MYVLVPMPALFFSSGGDYGSNLASGWQDAGKFLVGFSAVGSLAIPAILYHAAVRGGGGERGGQRKPPTGSGVGSAARASALARHAAACSRRKSREARFGWRFSP